MKYLDPHSLCSTLDSVSEALFFNWRIPDSERYAVAKWIAARQGLGGAYAGTFAPTKKDTLGIHLFTGESIRTRAGLSHVLGEECCRVLALLQVEDGRVNGALNRAVQALAARIEEAENRGYTPGLYCCGPCSAAYWRNLANGLLPHSEERLRAGLAVLKKHRSGDGRWRRFPFFYTCLVLTEIEPSVARDEAGYVAPYWQKNLKRLGAAKDSRSRRRAAVGQRLLEVCDR